MSARLRHWRKPDRKRTICGDRPPANPAPDGAPLCERCLDAAVDQGYMVTWTPKRQNFHMAGSDGKPGMRFSVSSVSVMKMKQGT